MVPNPLTFSNLGVKRRRVSHDAPYDFQWYQNVTLSPGQEYTYSTNRSFDQSVQYWCTANYQLNGNWNDVKWPNGTTNYVFFTAQNTPPPGNLVLIQDLSVSSSNPTVGQSICPFRVKNTGGQAITLEYLGIQGRLNGNSNGTPADFAWI